MQREKMLLEEERNHILTTLLTCDRDIKVLTI
jgi:hypothetical protein